MAEDGTQADLVLGVVMGFVFGVIMFFWIWDRGITRRQKMGMMRIQSRPYPVPEHGAVGSGKYGQHHPGGEWHRPERGRGREQERRQQRLYRAEGGGVGGHPELHGGLRSPLGDTGGGK